MDDLVERVEWAISVDCRNARPRQKAIAALAAVAEWLERQSWPYTGAAAAIRQRLDGAGKEG